ncbi:MAG: 4-hydroxy-tetrahydrodipicolinate reductase [Gemmatimonadales bacterium]
MSRLRLAIIGAGRMGQAVAGLAPSLDFEFAVLESADVRRAGVTRELLKDADVAVEFTAAAAAPSNIRGCARAGCPVVCGTTGWDQERAAVEADVKKSGGALLWAPNFAVGVHVFTQVVAEAGRRLRSLPEFDAHVVEVHHSAKKDAPSGTAKLLKAQLDAALGKDVPVTSIRTGSVPGTHTVLFDAQFEQLRLEHVARDRRVFASGALMAARWLAGKRGVFTLDDMLGGGATR